MSHGKFATVINCMDGRVQLPVNEWLRKKCGVDYVDTITEPGPNKILAENRDNELLESIKRRLTISVEKHGSKIIAIVGHHDCAGNPVAKEKQIAQITFAIETIKSWGYKVELRGLWVDENWSVNEVLTESLV